MPRRITCVDCATTEGVASYGLCATCAEARLVAECEAQGVDRFVTDGPTLDRVITLAGLAPARTVSVPERLSAVGAGAGAVRGAAGRRSSTAEGKARPVAPTKQTTRRRVAGRPERADLSTATAQKEA